jgi:hypothetical protein
MAIVRFVVYVIAVLDVFLVELRRCALSRATKIGAEQKLVQV